MLARLLERGLDPSARHRAGPRARARDRRSAGRSRHRCGAVHRRAVDAARGHPHRRQAAGDGRRAAAGSQRSPAPIRSCSASPPDGASRALRPSSRPAPGSCAPCRTCRPRSDAASLSRLPTPKPRRCRRRVAADLLGAVGDVMWVERRGAARSGHGGVGLRARLRVPAGRVSCGSGPRRRSRCQACRRACARDHHRLGGAARAIGSFARNSLRESVTSPGGTTAAALAVLRGSDGLAKLVTAAVAAAAKRGRELGK